jgi:hypothetical protein
MSCPRVCVKGIACGNSCIARDRVCKKGPGTAIQGSSSCSSPPASGCGSLSSSSGCKPRVCVKGIACGNSCIARDRVCKKGPGTAIQGSSSYSPDLLSSYPMPMQCGA